MEKNLQEIDVKMKGKRKKGGGSKFVAQQIKSHTSKNG